MNLTWRIVRKDLARHAGALGLWIAFTVVTTVMFAGREAPRAVGYQGDLVDWIQKGHGLALAAVLLQAMVGALIAASVVQEDPPGSPTAFWSTRPISRARMLGAKLLGAALLLAALPVGGLALVWLGCGFSIPEVAKAAVEHLGWQIVVLVPVMAAAATGGGSGRFLVVVLLLGLLVLVTVVAEALPANQLFLHPDRGDTRAAVIVGLLVAGGALALILGYGGKRALGWGALAAAAIAVVLVRVKWEREAGGEASVSTPPPPGVQWEHFALREGEMTVVLAAPPPAEGRTFLAPAAGLVRFSEDSTGVRVQRLERGGRWGADAALRLAGLSPPSVHAVAWELAPGQVLAGGLQERRSLPAVEIRLVRVHGRVLWAVPLREAAETQAGSSSSRLLHLGWNEDFSRRRILLSEREARLAWDDGLRRNSGPNPARHGEESRLDCYLVVNRSRGYAAAAALSELGLARMHSLVQKVRRLEISPAVANLRELADWDEGAQLLKVRFTSEGGDVRGLGAASISDATEGQR